MTDSFDEIVGPMADEFVGIAEEAEAHLAEQLADTLYILQLPMRRSLIVELVQCWNHTATDQCPDCAAELMLWLKEFLNMAVVADTMHEMGIDPEEMD